MYDTNKILYTKKLHIYILYSKNENIKKQYFSNFLMLLLSSYMKYSHIFITMITVKFVMLFF